MSVSKNIPEAFLPVKKYVQELKLPSSIEQIILDESFILNNPSYYLAYTSLFSEAFEIKDEQFVATLNIAGFLYYRFTIISDHFIDKKTIDENYDFHKYQLAAISCHEESIKLLCSLFNYPSSFWKYWDGRKKEYLWAVKTEKDTKNILSTPLFEKLADAKSAFGKIAIDALYTRTGEDYTKQYELLIASHTHFSQAFQLLDDILDLKEDLLNNQPNYALFKVKEFLKQEQIKIDETNVALLEKYMHVSGISVTLLKKALSYNQKAFKSVASIKAPQWKKIIAQQEFVLKVIKADYKVYIRYLDAKIALSKTHNNPPLPLEKSIKKAKEFLLSNFKAGLGTWDEYITNGNISTIWATAFITTQLCIASDKKMELCKSQAARFLAKKEDVLWGYNQKMPCDADSTNFALLALTHQGYQIDKPLETWLSFQNKDGGFATYTQKQSKLLHQIMYNGQSNITYAGWEQSHPCVSAVSLLLLANHKKKYNKQYQHVKQYLVKEFETHSSFKPYWWTSEIYPLAFISSCAAICKDEDLFTILQIRLQELIKNQNLDGSFGDIFQPNSAFYTAFMLQILCEHPIFTEQYASNIRKALYWLLRNQFTDGSWDSTYALRLPAINVLDPEKAATQWPAKRNGLNTRAIEFNRLFSTATVLKAFIAYKHSHAE